MNDEQKNASDKTTEFLKEMAETGQRMTQAYIDSLPNLIHTSKDMAETWSSLSSSIASNPDKSGPNIQNSYFNFYKKQMELWQEINQHLKEGGNPVLPNGDKRFKAPEWNESPYYFYFIKQTYLMASELMNSIIEQADIDEKTKKKLKFYTQLFVDALSPANFIATNPEVIKLAQQTNGESLKKGFNNLLHDIKQGKISQTDFSAFEIGKNIATTPGSVIFENEILQLIQYKPLTKKVYKTPLLIVPPFINRYYILDLEKHSSFARYAVEQGFTAFIVSWRVPKGDMGKLSFDDYIQKGIMDTIEVVREITGEKKINALGYCIGGTLLGTTAAILASRKKDILNTISFLASMHDFSDFGDMSAVLDLALVERLEKEIGKEGVLKGDDMNSAFALIRTNDMIWNYVVNNYLKGIAPAPFALMYWTNDGTNLAGNMYMYYLRYMLVGNQLSKKNALKICNTPVDLGKITVPCFVLGTVLDHISPCHTAFTTTRLVGGKVEFILGESGHVTGIVNPPTENNKYGYFINGKLGKDLAHFKETAQYHKESWWIHWAKWLKPQSGKQINAPTKPGNKKHKVIEPAPGRYVKEPL
jgi:polyhydroxyalkanoate synthase